MRMIDVATTATLRPKLLEKTYASFTKKLLHPKERFRLIINIDPIGSPRYNFQDVLAVAEKYFDTVVVNVPAKPNLSKAVKWCFSMVESEYVFWLEDDWRMISKQDIGDMINILDSNGHLYSIGLNRLEYKDYFHEFTAEDRVEAPEIMMQRRYAHIERISLNPVLIRKSFAKAAGKLLRTDYKPESQIRTPNSAMKKVIGKGKFASYITGPYPFVPMIEDIGREWMAQNNYKRAKKDGFLFWKEGKV